MNSYDMVFPSFGVAKPLFHKLCSVADVSMHGFTPNIIAMLSDAMSSAEHLDRIREEARVMQRSIKLSAHFNGAPELLDKCFGASSDLYLCLQSVADDARDKNNIEFARAVLAEYCERSQNAFTTSEDKIRDVINNAWRSIKQDGIQKKIGVLHITGIAMRQLIASFTQRLDVIINWLDWIENNTQDIDAGQQNRLRAFRDELLELLTSTRQMLSTAGCSKINVLTIRMLDVLSKRLTGVSGNTPLPDLYVTGALPIDDAGMPYLGKEHCDIKYYEPWRNVLKHISAPRIGLDDARAQIMAFGHSLFNNLGALAALNTLDHSQAAISANTYDKAKEQATDDVDALRGKMELALTYDRIDEAQKEELESLISQQQDLFFDLNEYGCWRIFLQAIERQMADISDEKRTVMYDRIQQELSRNDDSMNDVPIIQEAMQLIDEGNYAVAEEYITRYVAGERMLSDELKDRTRSDEYDYFGEFTADKVFKPLYDYCARKRDKSFRAFGWSCIDNKLPDGWTNRQREESKTLIDNWPIGKGGTSSKNIIDLFYGLGYDATESKRLAGKALQGAEVFELTVKSVPRNLRDYRHPIADYGTRAKTFYVIIFYGNRVASDIITAVNELNLGGTTFVLMDYQLELAVRRQMAEEYHRKDHSLPFILIDRVLVLFLAMHPKADRISILLKCALPHVSYQPYVRDGGSITDEMFFGRASALASIMDPNGACVVYGGRQLGKTTLLERAESLCDRPDNAQYAIYSSIVHKKSERDVVDTIVEDINRKTTLSIAACSTIKDLCRQFDHLIRNGRVSFLLLMLDESDAFLEHISSDSYQQLQPLIDLKRDSRGGFKFVLAGLHNVVRAKNALKNNGLFGQLGTPLSITPLSPADAMMLIKRPLHYLGFRFDDVRQIETILTKTNYYPGILQFFGYQLVQTLPSQYIKNYYSASDNPPFPLNNELLGQIMSSIDLQESIKTKFRLSLELDERYYMLARCVVYLYMCEQDDVVHGYTAQRILEVANEFNIRCLAAEDEASTEVLLDEMTDMYILSKRKDVSAHTRYRLRRNSFVNIVCDDPNNILDDIDSANV